MTHGRSGTGTAPHDGRGSGTEALRREIEHTREELGATVAALAAKADVKSRARDKARQLKTAITARTRGGTRDTGGTGRQPGQQQGQQGMAGVPVDGPTTGAGPSAEARRRAGALIGAAGAAAAIAAAAVWARRESTRPGSTWPGPSGARGGLPPIPARLARQSRPSVPSLPSMRRGGRGRHGLMDTLMGGMTGKTGGDMWSRLRSGVMPGPGSRMPRWSAHGRTAVPVVGKRRQGTRSGDIKGLLGLAAGGPRRIPWARHRRSPMPSWHLADRRTGTRRLR